jgi:hypothetical protein
MRSRFKENEFFNFVETLKAQQIYGEDNDSTSLWSGNGADKDNDDGNGRLRWWCS